MLSRYLTLALLFVAPLALAQNAPIIVIDAGHGGADSGMVFPYAPSEKAVALGAAQRIAEVLRAEGFDVRLTREDDTELGLRERPAFAEGASLLISVHVGHGEPSRGVVAFVRPDDVEGRAAARAITGGMLSRGLTDAAGVREGNFSVLQTEGVPSLMLEVGSARDSASLSAVAEEEYLSGVASAVVVALRERAF